MSLGFSLEVLILYLELHHEVKPKVESDVITVSLQSGSPFFKLDLLLNPNVYFCLFLFFLLVHFHPLQLSETKIFTASSVASMPLPQENVTITKGQRSLMHFISLTNAFWQIAFL